MNVVTKQPPSVWLLSSYVARSSTTEGVAAAGPKGHGLPCELAEPGLDEHPVDSSGEPLHGDKTLVDAVPTPGTPYTSPKWPCPVLRMSSYRAATVAGHLRALTMEHHC
ncbi:hypothetical protein ACP4OV_022382 [Aristida adscensionis]